MPTFKDPVAAATEAREAIRGLAHATRAVEDPAAIYPVLGSISAALASLTQTLHQLGDAHDSPAIRRAWINGDSRADTASSYRVSWELHRAAEMVHQVAAAVDRAHEIEATIAYDQAPAHAADSPHAGSPLRGAERGLSL
ncbi:hypothetical protein ASC77_23440 [Nocardioides sp. Root1257]|uniref:hypothetical protein n=1 Tax=unclassified Nocardioides TaxID=2615069 RepID=UPI0006F7091C|nr:MULTISPECIES: hypothetical protein [unclassified Nocardioides]KQW42624.1 hypothetical protein ASC77_23440 [Nocardioides sp. Root1257]KRC39882.1 hypothetical protein ASE24_23235 [Nocardioides sp. Root224]